MTTQNFIERIAQETCALICERTCSSMCSDDLISNAIQSFARKVVGEMRNLHPNKEHSDHLKIGFYNAKERSIEIVSALSGLSGEDNQHKE